MSVNLVQYLGLIVLALSVLVGSPARAEDLRARLPVPLSSQVSAEDRFLHCSGRSQVGAFSADSPIVIERPKPVIPKVPDPLTDRIKLYLSDDYQVLIQNAYGKAQQIVLEAIEANGGGAPDGVVVFDLDETTISNVDVLREIGVRLEDFGEREYRLFEAGQAISTPIPFAKCFIEYLESKSVKYVFLSSRGEHQRQATESLLKTSKMWGDNCQGLYLRTFADVDPYKQNRLKQILTQYGKIILSLGNSAKDCWLGSTYILVPHCLYSED